MSEPSFQEKAKEISARRPFQQCILALIFFIIFSSIAAFFNFSLIFSIFFGFIAFILFLVMIKKLWDAISYKTELTEATWKLILKDLNEEMKTKEKIDLQDYSDKYSIDVDEIINKVRDLVYKKSNFNFKLDGTKLIKKGKELIKKSIKNSSKINKIAINFLARN